MGDDDVLAGVLDLVQALGQGGELVLQVLNLAVVRTVDVTLLGSLDGVIGLNLGGVEIVELNVQILALGVELGHLGLKLHIGLALGSELLELRQLTKIAEGAAQNGDGAARVLGFAPYARVASIGRSGTVGELAQVAGVVEGRECAQTGELRLVHMLQRAHGLSAQQLTQANARFVRAVQVGVKRDDAHAATSRLVQCSAALGTHGIGRTKGLGRLDIDGMMRQQHVGAGLESAVHVGFGCVECTGNTADLGSGISHR